MATPARRRVAGLVGLVLLVGLGGCGADGADSPDSPDSPGSASGTDGATPAKNAAPTVAEVRDVLRDEDTGRVATTVSLPGTVLERRGTYRLSDNAASLVTTVTIEGLGTLTFTSVSVDDRLFAQIDNGNGFVMKRCWLEYDLAGLALAAGSALPSGTVPGVPPEVLAVLDARAGKPVTTGLFEVASSFGFQLAPELGVEADSTARTPIRLRVADGTATLGWDISTVLDSVEEAGLDVPTGVRAGTKGARVDATISEVGETVRIVAPAEDRIILFDASDADDTLDAALRACEDA